LRYSRCSRSVSSKVSGIRGTSLIDTNTAVALPITETRR
jgi:hypothetical protein